MATSDDNAARGDFNTMKRKFLNDWYNTSNNDIAPLVQRWIVDNTVTSVGGENFTSAGTAADSTHAALLLERASQGKTS